MLAHKEVSPECPAGSRVEAWCSIASRSPLSQLIALSAMTYWLPRLAIEPESSLDVQALAAVARDRPGHGFVGTASHEAQRFEHAIFGHDGQVRRLAPINSSRHDLA